MLKPQTVNKDGRRIVMSLIATISSNTKIDFVVETHIGLPFHFETSRFHGCVPTTFFFFAIVILNLAKSVKIDIRANLSILTSNLEQ